MKGKTQMENKENNIQEYSFISNIFYVLKKSVKQSKYLLVTMLFRVISKVAILFLGSFASKYIIDIILTNTDEPNATFLPILKCVLVLFGIGLVSYSIYNITINRMMINTIFIRMKFAQNLTKKYIEMDYSKLEDPNTLDAAERAKNTVQRFLTGIEGMIYSTQFFMESIAAAVFAICITGVYNIYIIAAVLVFSILQFLFTNNIAKRDKKEVWDVMAPEWRKIGYMDNVFTDFFNAKDIRIYELKDWLSVKLMKVNEKKQSIVDKSRDLWRNNALFANMIALFRSVVVFVLLGYSVIYRDMSVGDFTLYYGCMFTFSSVMLEALIKFSEFKQRSREVSDYRCFMDIPDTSTEDLIDVPKAKEYEIKFVNVSFKYPGQDLYTLKNFNLTLNPNKSLAIVGLNGAGKTTVVKLMLRLYKIEEGEILLNGVNINKYSIKSYHDLFSPVFQDIEIFAFPILENVSMDISGSTDGNRVEKCISFAGLGEKINNLNKGIHTEMLKVISEDGVDFSGGERQKLAFARALYKNSPCMIFDEPSAALDPIAENKMFESFNNISDGKTALYITHRLSSVRFCDSIALISDGTVAEYGTHQQLIEKDGIYADMYKLQSEYYSDEKENRNEEE